MDSAWLGDLLSLLKLSHGVTVVLICSNFNEFSRVSLGLERSLVLSLFFERKRGPRNCMHSNPIGADIMIATIAVDEKQSKLLVFNEGNSRRLHQTENSYL